MRRTKILKLQLALFYHLNDEASKPNQTIAKEVLEAYMEMYKNVK